MNRTRISSIYVFKIQKYINQVNEGSSLLCIWLVYTSCEIKCCVLCNWDVSLLHWKVTSGETKTTAMYYVALDVPLTLSLEDVRWDQMLYFWCCSRCLTYSSIGRSRLVRSKNALDVSLIIERSVSVEDLLY